MSTEAVEAFPGRDELLGRIREHTFVQGLESRDPSISERFYPLLLNEFAERKSRGRGVHLGLELVIADYAKDLPASVAYMMGQTLTHWIEALVTEPQVRQEALDSLRQVRGQL